MEKEAPLSEFSNIYAEAIEATAYVQARISFPELKCPSVAVICGSGLSGLAETIRDGPRVELRNEEVPHLSSPTVEGHEGKLVFGLLGTNRVPSVLMVGRLHFYEGHSIQKVTFPIRVFKLLGVKTVIVTNAAGGLNPEYSVGDIVVLHDHLYLAGLAGIHPLRGPNIDEFGVRFPPLSDAHDLELRRLAHKVWKEIEYDERKRRLHEGVYAYVVGPSYETRAECRMLRTLGADLVGMSTVPEIIVSRHTGLRVVALSLVTNNAVLNEGPRGNDPIIQNATSLELRQLIEQGRANHEEVLEEGRLAAIDMQALVAKMVDSLE